jgi:amino acid adenylation domain-containing protein
VEYNRDLFDGDRVGRMVRHFEELVRGVVRDADEEVCRVRMVSEREREEIVVGFNETSRDYERGVCVHEMVERQAEMRREAIAVVCEGEGVTYKELNERASRLAHYLRSKGVGTESRVGVCLERSVEMVVGLLGVMKAGGAYVPLDPGYPRQRLDYMLENAQISVLLTVENLLNETITDEIKVICLDTDWTTIARESKENPINLTTPENIAYVIYTSGSTGMPKGVMNSHGGLCNRLFWMQEAYGLSERDCVLQKTPFSFDVSVWEFFWPLMTGARLVMARPGGHQDSSYLVELIARENVTTIHFVPPMLEVFLEDPGVQACRSLKRVICSGEALPFALQEKFFARLDCELHNLYGPTEAAIDVTSWPCERDGDLQVVPIGRPIANIQIYILDAHLEPVPVGVAGELHIGGVGLARGYVNRPDLTAERFIPDLIGGQPGARLYKTGDLARYLSGGSIEYLGRLDHQLKIRGFRVELGEIEAVLRHCAGVREAVVIAREDDPGDKRLVGYLVAEQSPGPSAAEMRDYLKARLPDYMVPSAFVTLEQMPVTSNGKIDRKRLPAPSGLRAQMGSTYSAPRTEMEQTIADVWQQLLRVDKVGIHDNFFDLGGHSLLVVQGRSKLQEIFNRPISIIELFQYPTISSLISHLNEHESEDAATQRGLTRAETRREMMKRRRQSR